MKALLLKLYQNLCNYRREGSFGYIQTYPLPTPSMIRGMVHSVLHLTEYKPLEISIQGESDGVVTNIQRVYKFDRDPKSRPDNPYQVLVRESKKTATHGISFVDQHINMRLIIHIRFNEEGLLEELFKGIQQQIIIIGRNEDIARVDEVKLVKLFEPNTRHVITKLPMYVLPNILIDYAGTTLTLPFWYENVSSFEENRVFHFISVNYVGKGTSLRKNEILTDEDENIVCMLS